MIVVEGEGEDSSDAVIRFFEYRAGWVQTGSWSGHVGRNGWSTHHVEGDLSTPVGVFTLSDAGGRLPDPGTELPYYRSPSFTAAPPGAGFGDSVTGAFDYVIAIDYNRVPGRSPLDMARPQGQSRGGGIWLHVDHRGPTHGCPSAPRAAMRYLLGRLEPARHPMIVMGPRPALQR